MDNPLSPAAERFLTDCISSALQLDALSVLTSDRNRWWTTPAMATALRATEAAAAAALEALGRSNVVDVRVGAHLSYRYAPVDAALARVVDEITDAHYHSRDDLIARVTGLRRTSDAARRIADAFRIGRKPDA
ncbi:MAG TPA: hypothetical protein VL484_11475 [Vicinamibacterales bacterium]|nr:hypothetical protein [Vicinamibacterales bacterium]